VSKLRKQNAQERKDYDHGQACCGVIEPPPITADGPDLRD